jgi:hypothetical protein
MDKQKFERTRQGLEEVANAANRMCSVPIPGTPGYNGDEAIAEGRRVMARIAAERERERQASEGSQQ